MYMVLLFSLIGFKFIISNFILYIGFKIHNGGECSQKPCFGKKLLS